MGSNLMDLVLRHGIALVDRPFPLFSTTDDGFCKVCVVAAKIVSICHFSGRVAGREKVVVRRERFYAREDTSIMVQNAHGVQVGYVDPPTAEILAPLMDSRWITVDGLVPSPGFQPGMEEIPCQLHVYTRIELFRSVKLQLFVGRVSIIFVNCQTMVLSQMPPVEERTNCMVANTVDAVFASLERRYNYRPEAGPLEPLRAVITTELMPHQKQALGWLFNKENSGELPPFWVVRDCTFVNELTGFRTAMRCPSPNRGGIFADEMGLGKTLTLLSLIAFDRCSIDEVWGNDYNSVNNTYINTSLFGYRRCTNLGNASSSNKRPRLEFPGNERRTTLVICPPSVLSTWSTQLQKHTREGSLKLYAYYGQRTRDLRILLSHDIVLTTYSTLAYESRESMFGSTLCKVKWWRIILDEAHTLRNVRALQTMAVMNLQSERRWVVTGMPINHMSVDIFALLTFVKFHPFYDMRYWKPLVQRPLAKGNPKGQARFNLIMKTIALIRTKQELHVTPEPIVYETRFFQLSQGERKVYDEIEQEGREVLGTYIDRGEVLLNYSNVLGLILRLRQLCTDKSLCPFDLKSILFSTNLEDVSKNPELLKKMIALLAEGDDLSCPICLSPPADTVITRCTHIFCRGCILRNLNCGRPNCPMCRSPLTETDLFVPPLEPPEQDPEHESEAGISSKGSFLIKLLSEAREEDPRGKSVVFSQFRKMLVILEKPLKQEGFHVLRLDWTMSAKRRAHVLQKFNECSPNVPTVLLASLRAAGLGINLTAASTVYLLEPWWTPLVEDQAIERVHSIGRRGAVKVVRIIAKNTIEERVLALQQRKRMPAQEEAAPRRKRAWDKREVNVTEVRSLMQV